MSTSVETLTVIEIYHSLGTAYAEDSRGKRFLVNRDSVGVDFGRLEFGQALENAHVTDRNYVASVGKAISPPAVGLLPAQTTE